MHYSHAQSTRATNHSGPIFARLLFTCCLSRMLSSAVFTERLHVFFLRSQCYKDRAIGPAELDESPGLVLDEVVQVYLPNNVAVFGLETCGAAEVRLWRIESILCFD